MKQVDPLREVKGQSAKMAIAMRGMFEHYDATGEDHLRLCQDAAVEFAKEIGSFISPGTTSKAGREMVKAGIWAPYRKDPKTKKNYVDPGPNYDAFKEFLEEDLDWGAREQGNMDEDKQWWALLDSLDQNGHIRANNSTNKIPSKVYSKLAAKVTSGELDVIFVKPGTVAGVKHQGKTVKAEYYVED